MNSLNCAIFNEELVKSLGKRSAESDLEFYTRVHNERILTFVYPKGFPDKINSLLQALHLANYVLLTVDKIDAELGETIVAIDSLQKQDGFLIVSEFVDEDLLKKVISGTVVEKFEKISKDEILDKLSAVDLKKNQLQAVIDLDAMFTVKSVGVVALGILTQGVAKKHDDLKLLPINQTVNVKSIQINDKDCNEAETNDRVGLSLKNTNSDNFSRGFILTSGSDFFITKELTLDFETNKFYKKPVSKGLQLHLQCRLQVVGCKILEEGKKLKLEISREIVAKKNELVTLIDLNSKPRIIGKGKIV